MTEQTAATLTFLFTDIEGSTTHWERQTAAMQPALARHDALLRAAITAHGGTIFKTVGDAFYAVFSTGPAAVGAALAAQVTLRAEPWPPELGPLRVRMAVHTGTVEARGGDYFGPPLNRVARLLNAGHGGQILLSAAAHELVRDSLPENVTLRDLGQHRLKDLTRSEHIHQVVAPDLPAEFPALRTLEGHPTNLPAQATPLIGREGELTTLHALYRQPEVRLLTLTGPGGTGKTRLALQLAADLLDGYPDGAFFVDLAPILDPTLVVAAIAAALGLRESGSEPLEESVAGYLRDKHLLLVLDNFEQVVAAAPLVSTLLAACPGLRIVVASRTVLRVYGEHEYAVPPLALPPRGGMPSPEQLTLYAAVALFTQRAQAVQPAFRVTNATAPAVAEICARLDGLPLAIELAAARVRLLPPPALLARLANRLGILTGGARTLPARQQTLRGAIDWSYQLLDPAEQALFARLSVFMGGRTLAAIEAVCLPTDAPQDVLAGTDVLAGVASLVEKSLLRQAESNGDGSEPRFVLLETLHEYARAALDARGETAHLRSRHAAHFLALAEEAEPHLTGPEQGTWLARLEAEHDNLRAALAWAVEEGAAQGALGLRLGAALARFWEVRGHLGEGRRWLRRVLAAAEPLARDAAGEKLAAARALTGAGSLAYAQGDYGRARALQEESLALHKEVGDTRGIAASLNSLGMVAHEQGEYGQAAALYEESLALERELGDTRGMASALNNLGTVAHEQGNYEQATTFFAESLARERALGNTQGIAISLNNLGEVAYRQGDYGGATVYGEESLALKRALGDKQGLAFTLNNLGNVAYAQGDYGRATALQEESVVLSQELGDRRNIVYGLEGLALVAAAPANPAGDPRRAALLLGAAATLRTALGAPLPPADQAVVERARKEAQLALGSGEFAAAWAAGEALSLEEAITLALGSAAAAEPSGGAASW